MKTKTHKENDPKGECVCGHNHITYAGYEDENEEEQEGNILIDMCQFCDCENFRSAR